jgi:hypothetical protein
MGHAYVVGEGCEEATVLGICSSADESLMTSLMNLHGPEASTEGPPVVSDLRRRASGAGGQ